MRIPRPIGTLIGAAATLGVLAACSATTSDPSARALPQQDSHGMPAWASAPLASGPRLFDLQSGPARPVRAFISPKIKAPGGAMGFLSDFVDFAVYIINSAGQTTGTLTGFNHPYGMAVDKSGNLYVADPGHQRIQVYAPPYSGSPTTLHDAGEYPADVAVDSNGNVAACNFSQVNYAAPPSVSFYPKGATSPSFTLPAPTPVTQAYFCAFDAAGNLYLDGLVNNTSNPFVGEVVGGISGTAITSLSLTPNDVNDLNDPEGLQVTSDGLLVIIGGGVGEAIFTFNPPTNGQLGDPVSQTQPVPGGCYDFAFTTDNKFMLCTNQSNEANRVTYPGGKSPFPFIVTGGNEVVGAAINPTEQY